MSKTLEQLRDEIQREFIGGRYDGVTATEEILTQIIGKSVDWYDRVIDDGADGDETEDTYVMKDCFATKDDSVVIRIYYGNVTEEIGYVSVSNS
jgi:hypothetical protein